MCLTCNAGVKSPGTPPALNHCHSHCGCFTPLCSVFQVEQIQAESVSMTTTQPSPFASPQKGDAPSSPDTDWQQQVDSIDIDEEGMREVYVAALEECKYDSANLEAVHTLAEKAQQMLNPRFVVCMFLYTYR